MYSICMATFNGARFLEEQLSSILNSSSTDDCEIIISDDGSTDRTIDILAQFAQSEPRIRILQGPRRGVVDNFANALAHARGDVIFLSDQDDIWQPEKVQSVLTQMENPEILAVVHNALLVDEKGNSLNTTMFDLRHSGSGLFRNLKRNAFVGCCMAVRAELLQIALPFPPGIAMHDWWLGLLAEASGTTAFLDDTLIKYRRHDSNVSALEHSPLSTMILNRLRLSHALAMRLMRGAV